MNGVGIAANIILAGASISQHFFASDYKLPIYAGLLVPDLDLLRVMVAFNQRRLFCLYFASWTHVLLDVPKFAYPHTAYSGIENCSENCTSIFLPGGVEAARIVSPVLNQSVLSGGLFRAVNNADTIRIEHSPGFLLTFHAIEDDFNRDTECQIYGQGSNSSIQLCIRSVQGSVAVGMESHSQELSR